MRDFTKTADEMKSERRQQAKERKQLKWNEFQWDNYNYQILLNMAVRYFKLNPQSLFFSPIEHFRPERGRLFLAPSNPQGRGRYITANNIWGLLKKNGLRFPNKKELNKDENLKDFVELFPKIFYQSLYRWVKQYKSSSEYNTGASRYEAFNQLQFTAINGNLYFIGTPNVNPILVTDRYADVFATLNGLPQMSLDLKSCILGHQKEAMINGGYSFKPYLPNEQPYYLVDIAGRRYEYKNGGFSSTGTGYTKFSEQIFKRIPVPINTINIEQILDFSMFLSVITDNDIEKVKQLAQMIAKIEMTRNPVGYITVIKYGADYERLCFERFIYEIYGIEAEGLTSFCSKTNVRTHIAEQEDNWSFTKKRINRMAEATSPPPNKFFYEREIKGIEINNRLYQMEIEPDETVVIERENEYTSTVLQKSPAKKVFLAHKGSIPTGDKEKILKKLINSERTNKDGVTVPIAALTISDKYSKPLSLVNSRHIVHMTNSNEEIAKLSRICKVKVIDLAPVSEEYFQDFCGCKVPVFSYDEGVYIRTIFALLGIKLLADSEKSNPPKSTKPTIDITDEIVASFVDSVCILDENAITYMDEIYSTYEACYDKLHTGKKLMRKILAHKLTERPPSLKYYRPHFKGKPNKWAIKGLRIDKGNLELLGSRASDIPNDLNTFISDLEQLLNPINDFLKTLPLDPMNNMHIL